MVLLENEPFLNELTKMFQKARLRGSVIMTFKRYDGNNKPTPRLGKPPLPIPQEYMCIVRAKSGTRKISTVIHQRDINKFQVAYSNFLKANLDGLKKLKKPKAKTKEA